MGMKVFGASTKELKIFFTIRFVLVYCISEKTHEYAYYNQREGKAISRQNLYVYIGIIHLAPTQFVIYQVSIVN